MLAGLQPDDFLLCVGLREVRDRDEVQVTAQDRLADDLNPRVRGAVELAEELGILGLAEYRAALLKSKAPFDYDKPIEGLRTLDRYTLQIRLKETRPRLLEVFAQIDTYGAVAREVIEAYAGQTMEHPVGTGPFVLSQWRRSSLIILDRNPQYRERYYDAQPAADDKEGQVLLEIGRAHV